MANNSEPTANLIIGAQLQRARELLQLTPEEVAPELNADIQAVLSWEEGRSQPNLTQLEKLAELYGREIDYFLRETPAPPQDIKFRGKPGQSLKELSKETKIVLARFDELCRTALEFETLLDKRPEVRLPRFEEHAPPEAVAQYLREMFGAGYKPIPGLRTILENEGVRIFELPIPEDSFSGFSFWHSDYGPCILVSAREIKGRRNFTLAHELAHLLYGHGSSLCYIPLKFTEPGRGLEYKANQIATELLLPEPGVVEDFRKRDLSGTPSPKDMAPMASKWVVSIQALGYRLENLGLIRGGHTDTLWEAKPPRFRRPRIPRWERQLGKRFVSMSIEVHQNNFISIGKLAHVLGIPIRKALETAESREE